MFAKKECVLHLQTPNGKIDIYVVVIVVVVVVILQQRANLYGLFFFSYHLTKKKKRIVKFQKKSKEKKPDARKISGFIYVYVHTLHIYILYPRKGAAHCGGVRRLHASEQAGRSTCRWQVAR